MSDRNMKSSSSVDDPFYENSTTSGSQDHDSFDMLSVFTGSIKLDNDDLEEGEKASELDDDIIAAEHKEAVARLKIVVMVVLFISVFGMSLAIYFFASRVEYTKFEEIFVSDATRLFEAFQSLFSLKMSVVEAYLTNIHAFSTVANETWPYVTTPEFAARASQVLLMTRSVKLSQFHFILESERGSWENYTLMNDAWVDGSIQFQSENLPWNASTIPSQFERSPILVGTEGADLEKSWYLPLWQNFPLDASQPPYNVDGAGIPALQRALPFLVDGTSVISGILESDHEENVEYGPSSEIYVPVHTQTNKSVVEGVVSLRFYWKDVLVNIAPPGLGTMTVVIANECNETFSYRLESNDAIFLGFGAIYDKEYRYLEENFTVSLLGDALSTSSSYQEGNCTYILSFFPTESREKAYKTSNPLILACATLIMFLFTTAHFTLYDHVVEFKNQEVIKSAARSNAIIKSLFPSTVRDRVLEAEPSSQMFLPPKARLGSFLRSGQPNATNDNGDRSPIADLFPECTVMFADIAGFTAWSSVREPSHVFTLLEAIYEQFDAIARKRSVFKVETIGDAYVAVTGLPDPRKDHAVVMVKFARECRSKTVQITRNLETTLGPGTGELRYRFGLHSGPVTAGVLRGQKSRFQLFGDTVNTAARMETTGFPNRIHISETTAQLLLAAGKGHWILAREERVEAKGKGLMQTYWIDTQTSTPKGEAMGSGSFGHASITSRGIASENERLIMWNTDILKRLLRLIVASRANVNKSQAGTRDAPVMFRKEGMTILDEVREIIELPDFDAKHASKRRLDSEKIELNAQVCAELREYVTAIAQSYRRNPFHSFDHASHVLMSVSKLLNRIVAPDVALPENVTGKNYDVSVREMFHDHTYGITSDPLTQFACVFAALIHDVDHRGVPNAQLVKEEKDLVEKYGDKSTAEQHSVAVAWDLLMSDNFKSLRSAICATEQELRRFRELVVNSVMATDIVDPDLKKLRNQRWEKAFSSQYQESERDRVNRKATIVIEHLIQASDVSHTMQHWHVYCKWNAKLFEEMYAAYREGRAPKDPSEFWYKGEIGFFDNYIIPLAKKLSECGVFGVSSDEYLNYALKNREEWERRGESVVASYIENIRRANKSPTEMSQSVDVLESS